MVNEKFNILKDLILLGLTYEDMALLEALNELELEINKEINPILGPDSNEVLPIIE